MVHSPYPHNRIFNDIVFEDRNKAYGAYFLRHLQERNMVIAIFFSLVFMLMAVNVPTFLKLLQGYLPANDEEFIVDLPHFLEPPPATAFVPPPANNPPIRNSPPAGQIQYVSPLVQADDMVESEFIPPSQNELANHVTGLTNVEGSETSNEPGPSESTGSSLATEAPDAEEVPFTYVEQMPEFYGGYEGLMQYLRKHITYPTIARETGITGKVIVQFIVTAEGKIEDARIMKGVGGGCDQEALRVIRDMPVWKPGKHNGRPVPVTFTLPISFELK